MSRSSVMAVPSNLVFGGIAAPRDTHDSLVTHSRIAWTDARGNNLHGLTLVAKDLFDIAGQPTGGGSQQPRAMAAPAAHAAHVVAALLPAEETLVGRARSDALAVRLSGCREGLASTVLR